jgi:8-oxo-dGTP pyrophosphatase MutT (NUDIX family)
MVSEEVRAAGGVVRRRTSGRTEIAVVHRPRYHDWSLPKGKRDPGEDDETTARREVEEETGLACRLGPEVGETRYTDAKGRPKVVRYWLMEPLADIAFEPNDEVDDLRWCSTTEASELLTYAHDRVLVGQAEGIATTW